MQMNESLMTETANSIIFTWKSGITYHWHYKRTHETFNLKANPAVTNRIIILPDVSPHPRGERGHHHHHLHHPHHHSVGAGGGPAASTFSPHGKQRFIATRPKSYSGGPSAGWLKEAELRIVSWPNNNLC